MPELVIVTWRDAHFSLDSPPLDDYLVSTVGFLIAETPRFLQIAQDELPEDAYRAITSIPVESVIDMNHLEVQHVIPITVPSSFPPATQAG